MRTILLIAALGTIMVGCQNKQSLKSDYQTVAQDPTRDTPAAAELNCQARKLLDECNLDQAEQTLKAALRADLFYGPAHNNLGTVYYRQKKLYLAAWEYQYACKLMPKAAEPRFNLGMVFEAVGKLADAEQAYSDAYAMDSDTPEIAASLARLQIRAGHKDDKTRELLTMVVMRDERPQWVQWAKDQLAMMGQPSSTTRPYQE